MPSEPSTAGSLATAPKASPACCDRSSAPHSIPRRRPRERVAAILAQVLDFFQRELDSGEYPNLRDFLGDDVDAGVERIAGLLFDAKRFDRGLKRLLDGIEASLPG